MKLLSRLMLATIAVATLSFSASAQTVEKKSLTLDGAKKVIAAAVAYAKKNNAPGGVIAVVDDGGNLMALERLDGSRMPIAELEEQIGELLGDEVGPPRPQGQVGIEGLLRLQAAQVRHGIEHRHVGGHGWMVGPVERTSLGLHREDQMLR